ncbi:UDP-N-acetylmuramoyl-L-alanine--D-glutamate ligase [Opitutus terrae]|uniref:UDP-N-acetylmuramoylalanine--D-glutamate ligase n=1 Tax=Opitutus terrae (strain DSM 11246 / JCM 15787 / PB90-1) TaxID=452637 RepID=B1ZU33_OPITP|nr:UDP-N-acetylmuramoyl-L-alanine--D-glutamate ligase [Opitutus terrae]ACB75914.1 UDP-N-acetylmuramoylalanine--D-glutamate ligase [Opitutus terrae PB90-1]
MPLTAPDSLAPSLAHPVAIFGGGVSGVGACALLAELGAAGVIYDAKGTEFTAKAASLHRLVIFSPGFPPEHPWLVLARQAGCECLAELDLASVFWRGTVIAVTGTNGKTTLTEFLTHALRSIGRDARSVGNVGHSFAQAVAESNGGTSEQIAVCEVSSFQAETLKHFRASATLWTNIAEDHLERHPGLESYFNAKWNLVLHTRVPATGTAHPLPFVGARGGGVFAGSSVRRFAERYGRPLTGIEWVATEHQPTNPRLAGTVFADYPQRENYLLAEAWWRAAGLPVEQLELAAKRFDLGRHRLALVVERDGATYWNDSKATNFHAVEAALERFTTPVVLIAGGKAKGGDLAGFVHRIAPRVAHVVLIGETSEELAFHCAAFRVAHTRCSTLEDAVRRAAELAEPGDHVLLSPGFASFDMFRSYADRGEQFEQLARNLGDAPKF